MSGLQTTLLFENWKGHHPSSDAGSAITILKLEHQENRNTFTCGISDQSKIWIPNINIFLEHLENRNTFTCGISDQSKIWIPNINIFLVQIVVYFDQILDAVHTRKLVEILLKPFSDFFLLFNIVINVEWAGSRFIMLIKTLLSQSLTVIFLMKNSVRREICYSRPW